MLGTEGAQLLNDISENYTGIGDEESVATKQQYNH